MTEAQKPYNHAIDVMKAILVIGMVFDHALMLLADNPTRTFTSGFKQLIDLVTFSAFLFCFGYATWLAYFSKTTSLRRILPSALRPFIAYFISAFFYLLFVERAYGKEDFLSLLLFHRIAPFSEFLLAFSLVLLFGVLLHKPIARLLENQRLFFVVTGLLLLTTLLPNGWVQWPLLSLFIGSSKDVAASFPLMQYFPLYMLGIYFARYEVKPNLWIGLAGMTGFYVCKYFAFGLTRFPPGLFWLGGSIFFAITWYAAALFLDRWPIVRQFLAPIGASSLFYLLLSNILIFAFRGALPKLGGAMTLQTTLEVAIGILAVIYFLTSLVRTPPKATSESH